MSVSKKQRTSREQEKIRFQAILDSAVDGVITINRRGLIDSVNPAAERLFGYSTEELIGQNVSMLMPPPHRQDHDQYLRRYEETRDPQVIGIGREVEGLRKDGTLFPLYLAVSETRYEGSTFYTGFLHDLTQLRAAEEQKSELGRILEESLNEMFIVDVDTLTILMVNEGLLRNTGLTRQEFLGRNLSELLVGHSVDALRKNLRPLVSGEQRSIELETVFRRSDGTEYDVLLQIQQTEWKSSPAYVGFSLDISERNQQQLDLRIRNQAIESASEGIVIADALAAGQPIVFSNTAFSDLTGYSRQEVLGKSCSVLWSSNEDSAEVQALQDAIHREKELQVTIPCSRKDGRHYWNEISLAPVRNDSGLVTHVVAVMEDISERREAQQQLLQSERLAAIGQMVTGLAHESRNALQRAQACLDMLALDLEDQPEQLELTAKTHRALNDLHRYYEEVRNYAAPIQLKRRPTDIAELWRITWRNLEPALSGQSVELRESIRCELPLCMVDDHRIEQVFRNIMENAIVAMPAAGRLHIDAALQEDTGQQQVRIAFRDNGSGFPADVIQKALHPFFTTRQKGTGLGLAISKRIVDAHGGSLDLGNDPGGGAEIVVVLPVKGSGTKTA